jgi:hypothetical protein
MSKINTRAELIDALRVASELEHQLMAQYLFAVYSMKRYTWEGLEPVLLERVRRWSSSITLIARQEMEHLGLALNLLSSIGGTPSFTRPNMPQRADYYGQAGIKLELTRGDLDTIKRFQRFEAPDPLIKDLKPGEPIDQAKANDWCDRTDNVVTSRAQVIGLLERKAKALKGAPVTSFGWSSIQDLYQDIYEGFETLCAQPCGEKALFVGRPSLQIFGGPGGKQPVGSMDDLNQYGVDLIGVTDLASAKQAITMILEQGEGISVKPSYLPWTHFCLFTGIREDMEANDPDGLAARPVVRNPMTQRWPDVCPQDEVTLLTNPTTIEVAKLFNGSYELMLLMLLYLYSDNIKTQEQVNGMMDGAFFPLMTMFVRPLAEILTELPAFNDSSEAKDGLTNAGPGFELNGDVLLVPTLDATWDIFQERIDALVAGFDALLANGDPWIELPGQREDGQTLSRIFQRLEYLRSQMRRLAYDWSVKWNIGYGSTG